MKIGEGFDVHRLVTGRPLILGGVEIEHDRGLEGHSDADVLAHAVADALLGAIGAGDLGEHFPASDERWRDAAGATLVSEVLQCVGEAGYRIGNLDATVIAQEPRLSPWLGAIRAGLAGMLSIDEGRLNVKLKSADRLGAIGRGEGIAARAVVLLEEGAQ